MFEAILISIIVILLIYIFVPKQGRIKDRKSVSSLAPPDADMKQRINSPSVTRMVDEGKTEYPVTQEKKLNLQISLSAKPSAEREITAEFKSVRDHIINGEQLILVTGGAGTGKTTLVRWLLEDDVLPINNIAIVAFTGVAALVCRGKTIHSFFVLPPTMILSDTEFDNIASEKVSVLLHLELLIIDEISMVRADLMDAIDRRLRKVRKDTRPFGGVQILMVGDPCQLPPVVGHGQKPFFFTMKGSKLPQLWKSPWFFHAKVFTGRKMKAVLLSRIFRQIEGSIEYLENLNKMRILSLSNRNQEEVIDYFNKCCYLKGGSLFEHAITITFTNAQALEINSRRLQELPGKESCFEAVATGCFLGEKDAEKQQQDSIKLPAPYHLVLKEGAQVMLLVNDSNQDYVNGSLATVSVIREKDIAVVLSSGRKIMLTPNKWESEDFKYNKETEQIERYIDGTYIQYPLALAWAFTAHKSQGKTLEKVNIITDRKAFASGQAYVALSRTRRIEDMKFSAPLTTNNFVIDRVLYDLKDYLY